MGFFDNPIEWAHTHFFQGCSHDFFSEPGPVVEAAVRTEASDSVIQIQSSIPLDLIQVANRWRRTRDPRSANLEDWLNRFGALQQQRSESGLRDQSTFFTIPSYSLNLYARANREELLGPYLGPALLQANPYVQININGLNTQFDPLGVAERGHHLFALGRGIRAGMTADIEFRNGNFDFSLSEPVWNMINNSMRWSDVGVQINAEWLRYYIGQSFAREINTAQSSPENLRRLLAENPLARMAYEAQQGQFRTPIHWDEVVNYLRTRPAPSRNRNSSLTSSDQTNSPSWFERAFPRMELGGNLQIQDYWSDGLLVLLHPHPSVENAQNVIFPSVCFTAGIETANPADSFYLRSHSHLDWDLVRLPGGIIFGSGGIRLEGVANALNLRLHLDTFLEASNPSIFPFSILGGNLRDGEDYSESIQGQSHNHHSHHIQVPSGLSIQRINSNEYVMSANLHLDTRIKMDNNRILRFLGIAGHEYQISANVIANLHYRKIGDDYYLMPGFNFLRLHNFETRNSAGNLVREGDIYFSDIHPELHSNEALDSNHQPLSGFYLGAELSDFFGSIFLPVTTDGLRYDWTTAFSHLDTYWRAWTQNRQHVESHPQLEPNFRFRVQSNSPQTCQRRVEFNFGHHDTTFCSIPTLHIQNGDANGVLNLGLRETGVMDLNLKTSMTGNWDGRAASIQDWGRVFTHTPALLFSQGNPEEILHSTANIRLGIGGHATWNFNEGSMGGFLNFLMSASLRTPNRQPSFSDLLENANADLQLQGREVNAVLNTQWSAPGAEIMMGVPSDAPGYSLIQRFPEQASPSNTVLVGRVERVRHPNPLAFQYRRSR